MKRTAREVFPAGRSMLCQGMIRGALLPCSPAQQHTTPAQLSCRTRQVLPTAPHTRFRSQHGQRLAPNPAAAVLVSTAPAQTADETEAAAPDEDWKIGEAGLQGPRDSMEDYTSIIRCGRCGFLVACECSGRETAGDPLYHSRHVSCSARADFLLTACRSALRRTLWRACRKLAERAAVWPLLRRDLR